jgi:hypothetical protein
LSFRSAAVAWRDGQIAQLCEQLASSLDGVISDGLAATDVVSVTAVVGSSVSEASVSASTADATTVTAGVVSEATAATDVATTTAAYAAAVAETVSATDVVDTSTSSVAVVSEAATAVDVIDADTGLEVTVSEATIALDVVDAVSEAEVPGAVLPGVPVYEPQYVIQGWLDDDATLAGWLDEELVELVSSFGVFAPIYEPQYIAEGWFDDQATRVAWFDEELGVFPAAAQFVVHETGLALDHLDADVVPVTVEVPSVHWGGIGGPGKLPELVEAVVVESAPAFDVLDAVVVSQGVVLAVREILETITSGPLPAPQSAPGPAADVKDWRKYNEELLLLIE